MKMPTAVRLARWYKELLETGIQIGVIDNYRQIQQEAGNVDGLPYMDGDLWVTRLNEAIDSVNKDRAKDCIDITKLQTRLARESQPDKIMELRERIDALQLKNMTAAADTRLWELLTVQVEGFNREYFVIHLDGTAMVAERSFAENKLKRSRRWLNDRHLFMDFFWGNILEFSSERRAQYSTFILLWRIFLENNICANCRNQGGRKITGNALCRSCHAKWQRYDEEEEEMILV